jgi:uncharacterized protein YfbU (UPF0304 family)
VVHTYVKALAKIANRYAPSRVLSFNLVHHFKALQLVEEKGYVSRSLLCKELSLGEDVVRTLLKHLKMQGLRVHKEWNDNDRKRNHDTFRTSFLNACRNKHTKVLCYSRKIQSCGSAQAIWICYQIRN